jgi:outer membrane receptor protein involved in Fe transport
MPLSTFPVLGQTNALTATGLNTLNGSVALTHGPWLSGLYVTNLTDKRAVVSPGTLTPSINNLGTEDVINPPRMINLRLAYSFGTRTGE